jgi:DNA-binding CsgD family transcriptional regulator
MLNGMGERMSETKKLWEQIYEETIWDEEAAKSIAYRMEWQGMSRSEAEARQREETRHYQQQSVYTLMVGDLCVDYEHGEVWFDGQRVDVNPVEYRLLLCLTAIPGRLMSYSDILRQMHIRIWEHGAQEFLQSHVRNLYQKIDPRYLVELYGVGYLVIDPEEVDRYGGGNRRPFRTAIISNHLIHIADDGSLVVQEVGSMDSTVLPPQVSVALRMFFHRQESVVPLAPNKDPLTNDEMAIMPLAACGYSDDVIASHLGMVAAEVRHHINRILVKFQLDNQVQLAMHMVRRGLIRTEDGIIARGGV